MKNYEDKSQEVQEPDLTRGKIFKMTPAPLWRHQEVLGELYLIFRSVVKKPCQVGLSPLDVYLIHPGEDWKETKNILQPDLCIICDPQKIHKRGCMGAPDLALEILSPKTAKKDLGIKRDLYEEYGVKELWIVHPNDGTVLVHILENGKYRILPLMAKGQILKSPTFPGLQVDLNKVFPDE